MSPSFLKPLAAKLALPLVWRFSGPYGPIDEAAPSNFVIGRDGVLHYAKAGAFEVDDLNSLLAPLLREAAPPMQKPAQTPT